MSPSCLGVWTLLYRWTQEFSDGEILSEDIEVPFLVTQSPLPVNATWGGGNPSELPCAQSCYGDPVNTATGDYYEKTTDLSISGRGPGLELTRAYSSRAADAEMSSPLGRGWTHSYEMSLSIDPETEVATVTNANGSQTNFFAGSEGYFAEPRVLATLTANENETFTYTVRNRTIYNFDNEGRLTSIADLNGEKTALTYDESGRVEKAEDGAGRYIIFEYNEAGQLEAIADSTERSVGYEYNEAGYLEKVTGVRGSGTEFTYDEDGLLLSRTDPRENTVVTNTYDSDGRILTQSDGLENESTFEYASEGATTTTTTITNPRGYVTDYEYRSGIQMRRTEAVGTENETTWSYEHHPATLGITAVTDPNGHTTKAAYDERGNQTWTEDALGNTTETAYNSLDKVLEHTDAGGVTTTYEYDGNGNLLSVSTPLVGSEPPQSRVTTYSYEDEEYPGDLTAVTDASKNTETFTYSAAGDLLSATDALSNETTYTYDERGNRLTSTSPRGHVEGAEASEYTTTYTYDEADNRLSSSDPLGGTRKWEFDPNDNVKAETSPSEHTTSYTYNANDQLIETESPNGDTTEISYDANSNVATRTDGLENTSTYGYDPFDNLATSTDPLERKTSYKYDAVGNLLTKTDAKDRTTTYTYDDAYRLTSVTYSEEGMPGVEYEYDDVGRTTSMSDGSGESAYEYDSLGRLVSAENGHGDVVSYDYDLAGNATVITYPNGKEVLREFDDAGRLKDVTDWLENTTSFSYDANSNLTATTFPEGTGNTDEYEYDRADRMTGIDIVKGAETLASITYSRDTDGRLEEQSAEGLPGAESEAFEYDENSRLLQAGADEFAYDAANNLTELAETTLSYDDANQIENRENVSFSYNKLGERVSQAPGANATYVSSFGSAGSGNGQFNGPEGVAIDEEENFWVVDADNHRVQKFNQSGEYVLSFGSFGDKKGQFIFPTDVAIDEEGNLWVTDTYNHRVQKFDQTGKALTVFGKEGQEDGELNFPGAVLIDASGNIWVADCCDGRIQQFTSKGKFIRKIGSFGTGEGQIYSPVGIALGSNNDVWVADFGNRRLSRYDEEGKFLSHYGMEGTGDGEFTGPTAMTIDAADRIWVTDGNGNERVQGFNQEGEFLGKFGSGGSEEGEFDFSVPGGIATDSQGDIWISDSDNDRIQQWEVSESEPATSYAYDQVGNLTSVQRPEAEEAPGVDESYAYDGVGLRVSQTAGEVINHLTWDQSGDLPLLLDDNQASYIYGPNGLPIEHISEGEANYYHQDQIGSTRLLTNSGGEVNGAFSYTAYGCPAGVSGNETTPLGYAGQVTNSQSGLQYLRARVYDPKTGQFLSRDPLVGETGEPYTYAAGNPINGIDPSGLCNWKPWEAKTWTEGNCISESPLNPIPYYEKEIEAIEAGCSYWEAVKYGLQGAGVLAFDVVALGFPAANISGGLAAASYWAEQFATRYPRLYLFAVKQASEVGAKPPVAGTALAVFWDWMDQNTR